MKVKDYWRELRKEESQRKWDYGRIALLLYILRDMHELGANCDKHKAIDEGIKEKIELEKWKWTLLNG